MAGSIDDGSTNTAACNVLEGATAAFARGAGIYGLPWTVRLSSTGRSGKWTATRFHHDGNHLPPAA